MNHSHYQCCPLFYFFTKKNNHFDKELYIKYIQYLLNKNKKNKYFNKSLDSIIYQIETSFDILHTL